MDKLRAARYELLTTPFNISLAQGFAATGRFAEGIELVDETMRLVEANEDRCYLPELLRAKGDCSFRCRSRATTTREHATNTRSN